MIRIVMAEDEESLLGTIGSLLNLEEDIEIVGVAQNRQHALQLIQRHNPDLLILDIKDLLRDGPLQNADCHLLVFTTFAKEGYFARVQQAGASGYLLKDNPSEELTESIRRIMEGHRVYAPDLIEQNPVSLDIPQDLGTRKNYFSMIINKMKHRAV